MNNDALYFLQSGKLPINKFELDMLTDNITILIIAKRESGKSVLVRAILNHFKKIPTGIVIAPTDETNREYSDFIPESFVYHKYSPEIIAKVMQRQKKIIEKSKNNSRIDPRCFIVMDDCMGDKNLWKKDPLIGKTLFNGRHYKLTFILTLQDGIAIPPDLRANFDYVFLLANDQYNDIKRLHNAYAGMFPSFESFRQVFTELTADYGAMVIVKRGANRSFSDKIFYYKAPLLNYKLLNIGCKQMKIFNNNNINPNWKENKDNIQINEFLLQKKKNKVQIEKLIG